MSAESAIPRLLAMMAGSMLLLGQVLMDAKYFSR